MATKEHLIETLLLRLESQIKQTHNSLQDNLKEVVGDESLSPEEREELTAEYIERASDIFASCRGEAAAQLENINADDDVGNVPYYVYKNIVYDVYHEFLLRNLGYFAAITKLEHEINDMNNRVGGFIGEVKPEAIKKTLSDLDTVCIVQDLAPRIGIHPDYADLIVRKLIDKKYG